MNTQVLRTILIVAVIACITPAVHAGRDPLGYVDGMALHEYVQGNPVVAVDPTGHRNMTPGAPVRPLHPVGGKRYDVSHWPASLAEAGFYHFYQRNKWWTWDSDGSSAEYLILGGNFLSDVRKQSQQLALDVWVDNRLRQFAEIMFKKDLKCDGNDIFSAQGSRLIVSDVDSLNVSLSLGNYTVYWQASCVIGPKECNVPRKVCDDGCGSKARWRCDIEWFLYATTISGASSLGASGGTHSTSRPAGKESLSGP